MTTETNKSAMETIYEVWRGGDVDLLDEVMAEHMVLKEFGSSTQGIDGYKESMRNIHSTFPDLELEIHDVVTEDDTVVTYYTFWGTHEGATWEIEPTGKSVRVEEVALNRFEQGQCVEETVVGGASLYQQLGVNPPGP